MEMLRRPASLILVSAVLLFSVSCDSDLETADSPVAPELSFQVDLGIGCIDVNSTGVVRFGDRLFGTNGPDLIDCRNNTTGVRIRGRGGMDSIFGGSGPDRIHGGPGCDLIRGNDGDDRIRGGAGDDQIYTCLGSLEGGEGDDIIAGGFGIDFILGGPGNDILLGQAGRDTLIGGAGADTLVGGGGIDSCNAGTDPADLEAPSCET